MSDAIDRANDQAELIRHAELSTRKPAGPAPTGLCLWCDEAVPALRRWCDTDCRDLWQRRQGRAG